MTALTKPVTVIGGHYGSGKTEFAVNLALTLAREGREPITLVDLDIVNPYFCSREREQQLAEAGISLISPSAACRNADVPALSAEVSRIFIGGGGRAIVDVGGDDVGARVLGRYRPQFAATDFDFWMVLNANRPQTATSEQALLMLRGMERSSGLRVTGIVNNTHLCGMTTPEEVLRGAQLARETARLAELPLICHAATARVFDPIAPGTLEGERFPLEIQMKKPWE